MKKIFLPSLEIEFTAKNNLPPLVFAAGGRKPNLNWVSEAIEKNGAAVWAIDKGIEICQATGIVPVRLTGDNDSAAKTAWDWAQNKRVETDCFDPAKDRTDFQLALALSKKFFADNLLIVTGCFGGRLDHQFSLLHSLAADGRAAIAADEKETLIFLSDGEKAKIKCSFCGAIISLLPFSKICESVSISGVRWPLENATLTQNDPYAVSNYLIEEADGKFSVSLGKGKLGIYINHIL